MRKLSILKEFAAAVVIATVGCSTTQHDAVQTNAPAPEVMRGTALSNVPPINSGGPASMTVPSTEALAITAASANRGGKFLGYIEGTGSSPSGNYTAPTGQVIPPSLYANPEITVNSSISSGPNPIITSGAGEGGGVFIATAAAPVAANAGVTAGVISAPITTGVTSSAVVAPLTTGFTGAAPIVTTPSTIATPTNTANVLSVGQFAAGAGGGSTNTGSSVIVNSGPLPIANGTTLVNGNSGTLTPTISSSFIPSPNVASNPAVTITNNTAKSNTNTTAATSPSTIRSGIATASTSLSGRSSTINTSTANSIVTAGGGTRFAIGPSGMTSSSTITNNNSNGSIITASSADQTAARRQSVNAPSTSAPVTTGGSRLRAVRLPSSGVTAPVTQPSTATARRRSVTAPTSQNASETVTPSRQRAIRVTTSSNGMPVVTNVNDSAFMQRAGVVQRDQVSPQQ